MSFWRQTGYSQKLVNGLGTMLTRLRRALFGPTLELQSPLTLDECLALLREQTDPQWKIFGSKLVVGSVRRQSFSGCKRIRYGNAFRTFVFARFEPNAKGTGISLSFGISRFSAAFMIFWFAGAILIGGTMMFIGAKDYITGVPNNGEWLTLVVPPLFVAAGAGIVLFGRWLGRSEKTFLIGFFNNVLRTSPIS